MECEVHRYISRSICVFVCGVSEGKAVRAFAGGGEARVASLSLCSEMEVLDGAYMMD